jgi:transposase
MTPSKFEDAKKLLDEGMPPKDVTHNLGVSIPTIYGGVRRWKEP